jgi:hypothetical protein
LNYWKKIFGLKSKLRYGLIFLCLSCAGCSCKKQKKLDNRISLWRLDRVPYGTRYAYENLSSIFPHAEIRTSNRFPILFQNDGDADTLRTLIILTPAFFPEPEEMKSLVRFAAAGNQVFISSRFFDDSVFSTLHIKLNRSVVRRISNISDSLRIQDSGKKKDPGIEFGSVKDSGAAVSILEPVRMNWMTYSYPGVFSENHFGELDSVHVRTIGRNELGEPDFIRIAYARGGAVFLHLEPRAFSNFFLLHNGNKSYYDQAFSWLPVKNRRSGMV